MAIYPELVLVTREEPAAEALIQPAGGRLRPGQTNEVGSEDEPEARVLYEGVERNNEGSLPNRYQFTVEVRTEDGIATFASWLVAKLADRTVMLVVDDEGVESTEAAIREVLDELWRTS